MKTRHKIMSFLLSGAMGISLLPASAIGTVKAASVNYALTATATASGSETSAFGGKGKRRRCNNKNFPLGK